MFKLSVNSVVCVIIVAAFFAAAPLSRRFSMSPSVSGFPILARKGDDSKPTRGYLKPNISNVHSGLLKYAKETAEDQLPKNPPPPSAGLPILGQDRKQAVLALIHYPSEDLGFDIVFLGSRPGYRAMTLAARHRIEIYVRHGDGPMRQAFDLAHELGHAFDLTYNNEERRRKWLALRGIESSTPWFGCNACPDYGTPAGDFAETFAFLLLGPGNFHSLMAPQPTEDQISELAAFCQIRHASKTFNTSALKEIKNGQDSQKPQILQNLNANKTSTPY